MTETNNFLVATQAELNAWLRATPVLSSTLSAAGINVAIDGAGHAILGGGLPWPVRVRHVGSPRSG